MSTALAALLFGCFSANANATEPVYTEVTVVTANATDWNKILDEYEKYVDQYVKLLKKAMNGDLSAMTEYVKVLEKAQKLAEKLEKAEDDMTPAQMQRYMKILKKMTDAMK